MNTSHRHRFYTYIYYWWRALLCSLYTRDYTGITGIQGIIPVLSHLTWQMSCAVALLVLPCAGKKILSSKRPRISSLWSHHVLTFQNVCLQLAHTLIHPRYRAGPAVCVVKVCKCTLSPGRCGSRSRYYESMQVWWYDERFFFQDDRETSSLV